MEIIRDFSAVVESPTKKAFTYCESDLRIFLGP